MDVSRRYHAPTHTVSESFTLITPESRHTYLLRYHLFTQSELTQLLHQAGFTILATFSDYAGTPLTKESATMLFHAQKPK